MVSFSEDLDDFSLRLRVEAAPRVPRANRPKIELGSGTPDTTRTPSWIGCPLSFAPLINTVPTSAALGSSLSLKKAKPEKFDRLEPS